MIQNDKFANEGKSQITKSENAIVPKAALDNRGVFNELLDLQSNYRANGNVDLSIRNGAIAATNSPSGKPGLPQILAEQLPETQAPQNQQGQAYAYQGKRSKTDSVNQLNSDGVPLARFDSGGDSMDNKELANRYKSKLQSQSSQLSNGPAFTNDLTFSAPASGPTGGGFGGGGSAMGRMGGMGGMENGRLAGGGRSEFGVIPPSGIPLEEAIRQSIAPNQWESTGAASMNEFDSKLSLVVSAPQETTPHYMTSLAISLPTRGTEYFFTTPRGDAVLSANGISKTIVQRVIGLVMLVAVIAFLSRTRVSRKEVVPPS